MDGLILRAETGRSMVRHQLRAKLVHISERLERQSGIFDRQDYPPSCCTTQPQCTRRLPLFQSTPVANRSRRRPAGAFSGLQRCSCRRARKLSTPATAPAFSPAVRLVLCLDEKDRGTANHSSCLIALRDGGNEPLAAVFDFQTNRHPHSCRSVRPEMLRF